MAEKLAFEFGEPEAEVRTGRGSWKDDAETAVAPIDALIQGFTKAFSGNGVGYSRSVTRFEYPAITPFEPTGDAAEDEKGRRLRNSRIASRINERAADLNVEVHARMIRGVLHMVVGPKPVVTRKRKNGEDSAATAAAA